MSKQRLQAVQRVSLVLITVLVLGCLLAWAGRGEGSAPSGKPRFVTTVNPVRAILAEVAGDRAEVIALLPPNASPHTYEAKPSDAVAAGRANAFVHVAPNLDGWAAELSATRSIALLPLVPAEFQRPYSAGEECTGDPSHHTHTHSGVDPHFWTDPLAVKAMLPALAEEMAAADPGGAEAYRANATKFAERLVLLDARLAAELAGVKQQPIVLFHPSFRYLIARYGLTYGGVVEETPGREATPTYLHALVATIHDRHVKALFTEPQLSPRPAEVLAEAAGVPLFVLDPNGGVSGRMTYEELMLYNVDVLRRALQ